MTELLRSAAAGASRVHSIAVNSKGNIYTTEDLRG